MVKKTVSKERLERLGKLKDEKTGKYYIITLHHGLTFGPIEGLSNIKQIITGITEGGASGVIMHKGILRNVYRRQARKLGVVMHLSASTSLGPDRDRSVLIGTVQEALILGAVGVSIQVNIGADTEAEMLHDMGTISTECNKFKVPLLAMMYPSGPMIDNPYDVELIKHVARIGAELGADVVITNYTGSLDTFREVIKCCPAPVLVSGGPQMTLNLEILKLVKNAMIAGAAGVAIGRNVFQNEFVKGMSHAISRILKEKVDVETVYKELMESKK